MAKQIPPLPQIRFRGVVTAGHPLSRPASTAAKCQDFRVMPGEWLRLRSGRVTRFYAAAGQFLQFHEFRSPGLFGATHQLVQQYDGTVPKWKWISLQVPTFSLVDILTIATANDGSYASTNQAAVATARDKVVIYNGLGVRDGSNSRPPLASYDGNFLRYFGLDAYTISGNPTAAFAAGAGNNQVVNSVDIWVGIHNVTTGHYSNGVFAGTIAATGALGTITVSNLARLKKASHDGFEEGDLRYVFYATIDGGEIPYQILNATNDGPLTAAITDTSKSLSVASGTDNGWVLNLAAEMPTKNFPPRPMRTMAFVNSRIYGVLMSGGSGSAVYQAQPDGTSKLDFTYVPPVRYYQGLVYSAALSDAVETAFLGNPEESFPLENFTPCPTFEIPLKIATAPDGYRIQVLTPNECFLVEEAADGIHEWKRLKGGHGIAVPGTLRETPYGTVWVTQRKQIALLTSDSDTIRIISRNYQHLLSGQTIQGSAYIRDPLNEVDKYEVFLASGVAVVNDFSLADEDFPYGQGYSATNHNYTAAATLTDNLGTQFHCVAKQHIYTREGQPTDGLVVTYDRDWTGPSTTADTEITGEYRRHWDDFGDSNIRKELPHLDLISDEQAQVEWYADLEEVAAANTKLTEREKAAQSETDSAWRFKFVEGNRFWYKLVLKLTGHSADEATYASPADQGDLASNFYGSIMRVLTTVTARGGNRP